MSVAHFYNYYDAYDYCKHLKEKGNECCFQRDVRGHEIGKHHKGRMDEGTDAVKDRDAVNCRNICH